MFFKNIYRTFTDKTFYVESVGHSFWKRWVMLYVVNVAFALILIVALVNGYEAHKAQIASVGTQIAQALPTLYPQDLKLTLKNGELSTNQPEPYQLGQAQARALSAHDEDKMRTPSMIATPSGQLTALVTIDTAGSVDDFDTYQTAALALKKGIVVKQSKGEIRFYPYTQFLGQGALSKTYTFDYGNYMTIVAKIDPYLHKIPQIAVGVLIAIAVFLLVIAPIFGTIGWLVTLLLYSVLGYFLAMVMKRKQSYGSIYLMGMYLVVPIILLESLTQLVALVSSERLPGITGYGWIIYLILLAIFLPKTEQTPVITTQASTTPEPLPPSPTAETSGIAQNL